MTDEVRFLSIPELEFAQYFLFSPIGDTCTVNHYEYYRPSTFVNINGIIVEVPPPVDNQVTMTGSLSTFVLKLDRTAGIGVKSISLRARTRGFVTADKTIEYVICPNIGSAKVTPPSPYSPTTLDATNGQVINLSAGSLYAKVNLGAVGTDANVSF